MVEGKNRFSVRTFLDGALTVYEVVDNVTGKFARRTWGTDAKRRADEIAAILNY